MGFHQDGDKPNILKGAIEQGATVVQYLAHSGTTGSRAVHGLLCDRLTAPPENQSHFSEELVYISELGKFVSFFPNSIHKYHMYSAEKLERLSDEEIRNAEREKLELPKEGLLIVNISRPNRFDLAFFEMAFEILQNVEKAFLVLVEHSKAFKLRVQALFKDKSMDIRVCFIPFIDSDYEKLYTVLGVMDCVLDSLTYCGQTSIVDSLWGTGVVFTVKGNTFSTRVAASLVTAFGTPENVFESKDALVSKVSDILNNCLLYTSDAADE